MAKGLNLPDNAANRSGVPAKRKSGTDLGYQKNQKLKQTHDFAGQSPQVKRVKTDGRIGSHTPFSRADAGLDVNTNSKVQPHSGGLGAVAAKHMSVSHQGGDAWSPRVHKARAMAKPNQKAYANPVNVDRPKLKPVKPD